MRRTFVVLGVAMLVTVGIAGTYSLPFQAPVSAAAPGRPALTGTWDRLNPYHDPSPEHEVLMCGGLAMWHCVYDKHPEPKLAFEHPPDATSGSFWGEDVTLEWTCPTWFPPYLCNNVTFVAGGVMHFRQSDGSDLVVDQELIVTSTDGQQILYVYWVDQFFCPWYSSFDEALAANQFPLPFNGTDWPAPDCVIAP